MKKVLIVDDNDTDQFYSECVLKHRFPDIEIFKAYDGQEALELIKEHNTALDLILLDINMPRMNGHDFLAQYAKDHEGEIPVIAMLTSSDQEQDKEQTKGYKCVKDYMLKPMKKESLDVLQEIVANIDK